MSKIEPSFFGMYKSFTCEEHHLLLYIVQKLTVHERKEDRGHNVKWSIFSLIIEYLI
jgi:hypothetical protein